MSYTMIHVIRQDSQAGSVPCILRKVRTHLLLLHADTLVHCLIKKIPLVTLLAQSLMLTMLNVS